MDSNIGELSRSPAALAYFGSPHSYVLAADSRKIPSSTVVLSMGMSCVPGAHEPCGIIGWTLAHEHFGCPAFGAHKLWGIMGWPVVIAVALEHFGSLASGAHTPWGIMGWPTYLCVLASGAHKLRGITGGQSPAPLPLPLPA